MEVVVWKRAREYLLRTAKALSPWESPPEATSPQVSFSRMREITKYLDIKRKSVQIYDTTWN